jgi:hypothetical protein
MKAFLLPTIALVWEVFGLVGISNCELAMISIDW